MENYDIKTIGSGESMNTTETITLDTVRSVIPLNEAIEGWKWVGSSFKEVIKQDHDVITKQNEEFMRMVGNPETDSKRYRDASQHIREIREYNKEFRRDVLLTIMIVSLGLCGVRSISISR